MGVKKIRLAELTGDEARPLLAKNPVILMPLGSLEDQGPHAPMGDYLCAAKMAELIAEKATADGYQTIVAPVVPFGGADYFGTVPGGIALSQPTLTAVLRDMLSCLLRHNLTRLIFINGHSGNVQAVHLAAQEVYRERGVLIPSLYLWQMGGKLLPGILGVEKAKLSSGHGGDPLTSVVMHLFPDLIRTDMVPAPRPAQKIMGLDVSTFGSVSFAGVDIQVPVEIDEFADNGVLHADPRLCSAETGAQLTADLVRIGAAFIAHYCTNQSARPK